MPQEAWVLKCYQCQKFQVQLKNKAKKWQCKVCGAKQDLMTIFFKGQPSDCRVNVQNMNTAEGQIFEKLKEGSSFQDDNCCDDEESQNAEQNLTHSASLSIQSFAEEDEFDNLEHEFQPSAFDIEGFNESQERSFKENVSIHSQSTSDNRQSENNGDGSNKDDDYFDLSSIDFTIKTYNPSLASSKTELMKLSIFESHEEVDESLDF